MNKQVNGRLSGIELLKIIAILAVVIGHVTQTLVTANADVAFSDYVLPIGTATRSAQLLTVNILYYFGTCIGNSVFFVCSAWFMVGNSKSTLHKAIWMIVDVWTVSVLFLAAYMVALHGAVPAKTIIRSLLPTTFSNNWYITAYIVFLFIYPLLNIIIDRLTQRELLGLTILFSFMYIGVNFLSYGKFLYSDLLLWASVYFIIAYIKIYMPEFQNDVKSNFVILLAGIAGFVGIIVLTDILGLRISFFSDKLLYWKKNCNPFGILIAIGALNLMRQTSFKSRAINYVSSLSMLIYLIHENIMVRTYTRPAIWQWIYSTFGYGHIVLLILIYALALFIAAAALAAVYKAAIQKITKLLASRIASRISITE